MRRTAVSVALLLLLVALVYWPVAGFGFVPFDDDVYVYGNPLVLGGLTPGNVVRAFTTLYADYWIPATWASLMVDASLWGLWPGGFHLTNVALHAAAALLFFQLLRRFLGVTGIPLLAAALFATHPLHVESVAWVTERKDVLSQTFFLLFLHAWLSHLRRPAASRFAGALLLLALSLMSKPMAVTAPALLLVLDWWPLGRLRHGGRRRLVACAAEKLPLALIVLCFGVLTAFAQHRAGAMITLANYPLPNRVGNAVVMSMRNLGKLLWPQNLAPLYSVPPGGAFPPFATAVAATLLTALIASIVFLRRRQPWLAAGFAWYFVALLPVCGLFASGAAVMADRFTYLPLLGVYTAAACLAFRVTAVARHPARSAALLLIPLLLAMSAHRQTLFWHDGVTLFRRALAVSPDDSFVRNNLGVALSEAGRTAEALPQFEAAVRLDPASALARNNLGRVLGELGRPDEGAAQLWQIVEREPGNTAVRVNLGDLYLKAGRLEEAERSYQSALKADPAASPALNGMAFLRLEQGRLGEVRDLAATATALNPSDATAWYLLGTAEARLGSQTEAQLHLRRSLALQPGKVDTGYNLALSILKQGRSSEARELLEDLHRRHPEDTGVAELREQLATAEPKTP